MMVVSMAQIMLDSVKLAVGVGSYEHSWCSVILSVLL